MASSSTAAYLQVPVAEGKRDKRGLERHLPAALRFAARHLSERRRVLVHCAQGRDRSCAVAIALLVACYDDGAALRDDRAARVAAAADDGDLRALVRLDEADGKRRLLRALHRVVAQRPEAAPSRNTLKKLHRFFMSPESPSPPALPD